MAVLTAEQPYSFSFTASGLRIQDALKLAELYITYQDWDVVREYAIRHNVLQQRTTSSSKRLCREILSRLRFLSYDELEYLIRCSQAERSILLWISVCRCYRFIREFAVEVLREHHLSLNLHLTRSDYEAFFSSKASLYKDVGDLSTSTQKKVLQVIFRMLSEAGLLNTQHHLIIISLGPEIRSLIADCELNMFGIVAER